MCQFSSNFRQLYFEIICFIIFTVGSSGMVPYLQGVNLSGGKPSRKPFGVIITIAGGLFLGGIPAPFIYRQLSKAYSTE